MTALSHLGEDPTLPSDLTCVYRHVRVTKAAIWQSWTKSWQPEFAVRCVTIRLFLIT
jgi:hypothetical protein